MGPASRPAQTGEQGTKNSAETGVSAEMAEPLLDDERLGPSVAQACQQVPTGVEQKLPWLTPAVQISQDGTGSATRARVAPLGAISIFQVECSLVQEPPFHS